MVVLLLLVMVIAAAIIARIRALLLVCRLSLRFGKNTVGIVLIP
jgi:hypothetical protein